MGHHGKNNKKRKASPEYKIVTNDEQEFTVTENTVKQMNVLKDLFVDITADSNEARIQNVSSDMFKIIVDFCRLHNDDDPYVVREVGPHTLHHRDYVFLKDYESHFNELLVATDYLDFPRMMDAILMYIREHFVIGHTQESLCHNLGLTPRPPESKTQNAIDHKLAKVTAGIKNI
uniref:Skp1_POZ domain-containing protein n=1 Tax=Panagrellus redivivus TaxID=6233 RepID=A0A7E4UUJ3_PANRE